MIRLYYVAQFKEHFYIISCNFGRLLTTHPVSILWVKFYEITFFSDWFTLISKYWKLGKVFFGKLFPIIVILVFEGIYDNKYKLFFWIIRLSLFGGQKRKDYELELLFALFQVWPVIWCKFNDKIRWKSNFREILFQFPFMNELCRREGACNRKNKNCRNL